jgi:hypothetical protein
MEGGMDVNRLPIGGKAPSDNDYAHINVLPSGGFGFTASVALHGPPPRRPEIVHMTSPNSYATREDAEAAAIAWAERHGTTVFYIECDDDT